MTFMKLCFMKSPSFAKQNSCRMAGGLGQLRGASSLNPMNLRRIIPTEEASHFPSLCPGPHAPGHVYRELLRCSEKFFSGRRFSFFKNNLFEKGKC